MCIDTAPCVRLEAACTGADFNMCWWPRGPMIVLFVGALGIFFIGLLLSAHSFDGGDCMCLQAGVILCALHYYRVMEIGGRYAQ